MFLLHVDVLASLVLFLAATAAAFRPHAPHGNRTLITASSVFAKPTVSSDTLATTQALPYPISGPAARLSGESGRPWPTDPVSAASLFSNNTGSASCTINIPHASLDWWFPATYAFPVGTLTDSASNFTNAGNYLTFIPHNSTFDVASAITTELAYTERTTYNAEWDFSYTLYEEYTVKPTAALTSVVTRTAALPLPSGNIIPSADAQKYVVPAYYLNPASNIVDGASNSTIAAMSATPIVHFTAYEVIRNMATRTVILPNVHAYPYWVKGVEEQQLATGLVPEEFLQDIPESNCSAGSVEAVVTVLVVVDVYYIYFPLADPFIVHFESTASGWGENDDPNVVNVKTKGSESSGAKPLTMGDWIMNPAAEGPTSVRIEPNAQKSSATPTTPGHVHYVGSDAHPGPNIPEPTRHTVGTVGVHPVIIGPSSVVVVGSQTLKPGAPPLTIGDQLVSLASSRTAIVVGGKTSALPQVPVAPAQSQARPPPIITIATTTLTPNAATQFFISPGQTLTPEGIATIDGTKISLGPSASFVVIGGSTQIFPTAPPSGGTARPEIVIGESTYTALAREPSRSNNNDNWPSNPNTPKSQSEPEDFNQSNFYNDLNNSDHPHNPNDMNVPSLNDLGPAPTFLIAGQTLTPGHTITIDGTTIFLESSASFVVVDGVKSSLKYSAAGHVTPPPLTIGNGIFTALPGTGTTYQIGSLTLTPGGQIIVIGTTISLASCATALIMNGETSIIAPSAQSKITNPPILTIGSHQYTAAPGAGITFVISEQTLTPGGTITIEGTTIILAFGATEMVYGSSGGAATTALFPATTTRDRLSRSTNTREEQVSASATGRNGQAAPTGSGAGVGNKGKHSALGRWFLLTVFLLIELGVG